MSGDELSRGPSSSVRVSPTLTTLMSLRTTFIQAGLIVMGLLLGLTASVYLLPYPMAEPGGAATPEQRRAMFELLRPVALSNCHIERFGEEADGGYLMCGNLLADVESGYSYGISGYDKWGCDVARTRRVPVHQYDCFDLTRPPCPQDTMVFHEQCVGGGTRTEDGRQFDTVANQVERNGDWSKHLVIKMDVEGAEWESLLAMPDTLLERVDQLVVEFHGVETDTSLAVVRRLKGFFEVAHLHINNASCTRGLDPFTGWAYEVLFVNKRLASVDPARTVQLPHPLDKPNLPLLPDCQPAQFLP